MRGLRLAGLGQHQAVAQRWQHGDQWEHGAEPQGLHCFCSAQVIPKVPQNVPLEEDSSSASMDGTCRSQRLGRIYQRPAVVTTTPVTVLICFQQHGHKIGCTKPCSRWKSLRKLKHIPPFPILVTSAGLLNETHCLTMAPSCPRNKEQPHRTVPTQTCFGPERELN